MAGFSYTDTDLNIWKERALLNPSSWQDVVTRSSELMTDNFIDLYDSSDMTSTYGDAAETIQTNNYGHYTRDCAFYYLIKNDAAYGAKAKASILAQVRNYNPHFEDYDDLPRGDMSNLFHFGGVATRFLLAFDYCKDLFTGSEITEVETWMSRCNPVMLQNSEYYPFSNFPNRLSRDYSVTGNYAASGQQLYPDTDPRSWTHKTAAAVDTNRIYRIHTDWQNQDALTMMFAGMWAVYNNDPTMIDRTRIYYEEYIKFAIFTDGMAAENLRNDDAIDHWRQLGCMWYAVITAESYIYFADLLRRNGDNSMYNFTTSEGIWGSEGSPKNIKLVLDTLKSNITQPTRYWTEGVSDVNRLDVLGGTTETYRYRPELSYGPANIFFNDNSYKDTYKLNNALYDYDSYSSGPAYISDSNWINNIGIYSAVDLMFYDREVLPDPYEDCKKITIGSAYNCEFPVQPGLEPQIILINKKDISNVTIVNNAITDISLKPGKNGYLFEGYRQSIDARFDFIETGLVNGYSHNLMFQVFDISTDQKRNLQGLANGMTVGITFNMNVPGNEDGYFEVFGIGAGMEADTLTRINRDLETQSSFSVSLKTSSYLSEAKIPMNFFDTDYMTTLTKIMNLLDVPISSGIPYPIPHLIP